MYIAVLRKCIRGYVVVVVVIVVAAHSEMTTSAHYVPTYQS